MLSVNIIILFQERNLRSCLDDETEIIRQHDVR